MGYTRGGSTEQPAAVEVVGSTYLDIGEVLNVSGLAAGAVSAASAFQTGLEWVRNVIVLVQTDQACDVYAYHADSSGIQGWGTVIASVTGPTSTAYAGVTVAGASALLGHAVAFAVKNNGSAAATIKVRVQLLGQ